MKITGSDHAQLVDPENGRMLESRWPARHLRGRRGPLDPHRLESALHTHEGLDTAHRLLKGQGAARQVRSSPLSDRPRGASAMGPPSRDRPWPSRRAPSVTARLPTWYEVATSFNHQRAPWTVQSPRHRCTPTFLRTATGRAPGPREPKPSCTLQRGPWPGTAARARSPPCK